VPPFRRVAGWVSAEIARAKCHNCADEKCRKTGPKSQGYEPLLLENEREAVADLLQYLESELGQRHRQQRHYLLDSVILRLPGSFWVSYFDADALRSFVWPVNSADRSETNFFTGDPLRSLSTLSYSENVDLQRSAALAFAEITEKYMRSFHARTKSGLC
jgi:hypothetical protein